MPNPRIPPDVERLIDAHGRQLIKQVRAARILAAKKKAAGIPGFVHPFKNKTLTFDRLAYAACADVPTDVWTRLRKLVLAARIGSTDVACYRDELCLILHELTAPVYGDWPIKHGYSIVDMRHHLSDDDTCALVWEIWKQNPESVREVPYREVYTDKEENQGTDALAQVFLFSKPSVERHPEIGIRLSGKNPPAWKISFTDVNLFQALRVPPPRRVRIRAAD